MSNQSRSSQSSRSSSQKRNTKRPQRDKRKKNNSDEYDSDDEDVSQYEGTRLKNKQQPLLGPGRFNKRENKLKKPNSVYTPAATTFLYKPGTELPNLSNFINQTIEIRIACEYVNKNNQALILRQIWGSNGVYASHSDAVCIGIHAGLLALGDLKLTGTFYQGISLSCKVIKGKKTLNGQLKVPLLSRSLKTPCAHCLKPEKVNWLPQLGSPEQLISWARKMSLPPHRRLTKKTHLNVFLHEPPQNSLPENLLVNNLPPLNEGWIVWDMCNEPSQKYNLLTFLDRQTAQGIPSRTSYRLKTNCLYIETSNKKFEISMDPNKIAEEVFLDSQVFMISEIIIPQQSDIEMLQKYGVPLPKEFKNLILDKLKWINFEWGNDNVIIDGQFTIQCLKSFKFVPITKHQHL
ncbi:unnamed protein product (macronuclear) [Paramecium tetraurelia]|uniref:Uncharacterized protein n=1 Tax=Paramecium tetraurelia TaxID=5888 RepID=A0CVD6_PARTE|nr:uncharacterized protein GSPATT00010921001 [Paramecium tetraurelia]CAK74753.1 unnamed protein product [Paramecium tetraurelia]|eukprot:XP_001442150.1 hypothetical protein (macronuclear) [Paramecium tetraurelia strain d4-2]